MNLSFFNPFFFISTVGYGQVMNIRGGASIDSTINQYVGVGTNSPSPSSIVSIKVDFGLSVEPAVGDAVHFYMTSNSTDNTIRVNARTKYGAREYIAFLEELKKLINE